MRQILHIDMDAFYASVEQRDRPEFRGRPVIVGADPKGGRGRGVVAACSYEARKFGIHSAMPISQAWRRCPQGVYLPSDFRKYAEVSEQILTILEGYTDQVQPISIDEAFLDVTGSQRLFGPAETIARSIKDEIRRRQNLTASVGLAPNKFLAKIASDIKKPDGFVVVRPEDVVNFLHPLPVARLWGVGPKSQAILQRLGIQTIGDLASWPLETISARLGKWGEQIHELARGIDDRPVERSDQVLSVSHETTFDQDCDDDARLRETLHWLADRVAARLRRHGLKGRTVHLKLRVSDFTTLTRQVTLAAPTYLGAEIYPVVVQLFDSVPRRQAVRLLGVGASHFSHEDPKAGQKQLFEAPVDPRENVERAIDVVGEKFGEGALRRGWGGKQ